MFLFQSSVLLQLKLAKVHDDSQDAKEFFLIISLSTDGANRSMINNSMKITKNAFFNPHFIIYQSKAQKKQRK